MFMAVPVVFGGFLLLAMAGLFVVSQYDGCLRGPRVQVTFETECAESASELISARVDAMGLGEPVWTIEGNQITLEAQFPGYSDTETDTIPKTLATTGNLELSGDGQLLFERSDIEDFSLNDDDASGMPLVELTITDEAASRVATYIESNPDSSTQFALDGDFMTNRPNSKKFSGDKIRVELSRGDAEARWRELTDLTFVLMHGPMPCEVSVESVSVVDSK